MTDEVGLAALLPRLARVWGGSVDFVASARLSSGASRLSFALDVCHGGELRRLVVQRVRGSRNSDVAGEAALLRAAAAAGVPVPEVILADAEGAAIGGPFLITARVDGETIPRRILRDPALADARTGFATECGGILARIHRIPVDAVAHLPRRDPLDSVRVMLDDSGQHRPAFELGLRWLQERRPEDRPAVVVHGDFRNGNLVMGPEGIRAVLDWELSVVGNPVQDLGWLCARAWRWGAIPAVGGMGRVEPLLSAYRAAGGAHIGPEELRWWQVLATLAWGVMCLEQARTHLDGEHRSVELAVLGRRAAEVEYDVMRMIADV